MQNLLVAHQQLDVPMSDHTALMKNQVICATCTKNAHCLSDRRTLRSPWLASNGGLNQGSGLVRAFICHVASDMHLHCMESAASKVAEPLSSRWELDRIRRDEVMSNLLITALHVDKNKFSHRCYEREIMLKHLVGGDVGDSEHSRKTCRNMFQVSAEHR